MDPKSEAKHKSESQLFDDIIFYLSRFLENCLFRFILMIFQTCKSVKDEVTEVVITRVGPGCLCTDLSTVVPGQVR